MSLQASLAGPELATPWVSFCLTYLAHAAIFAVVATLVARSPRVSFAVRHGFWKGALFGPFGSAALAWMCSGEAVAAGALRNLAVTETAVGTQLSAPPMPSSWLPQLELALPSVWPGCTTLAWLAITATSLGLLRFAISAGALSRRLRHRAVVTEPRMVQRFEALRTRMGLPQARLTECSLLSSPLVIGRKEVCLPRDMHAILTDADVEAVLAHELAHVERGDGVWFPLVGAVQYLLWLQPLNHVVASRFRSSAELSCDDRALELTDNPQALGRALVRLAEAATALPGSTLAPAIVRKHSDLLRRVQRLAGLSPLGRIAAPPRRRSRLASVALVGMVLVSFSVRAVQARLPTLPAAARGAAPAVAAHDRATTALSASELSAHMAELTARDRELTAALARLAADPQAERAETPEQVRGLELGQELRHLRAMQAWLERSFVATERGEAQR